MGAEPEELGGLPAPRSLYWSIGEIILGANPPVFMYAAGAGFALWRLGPGETASDATLDTETILVLVEGRARIGADGRDLGDLGDRMDVFEATPPVSVYVPAGTSWTAEAAS